METGNNPIVLRCKSSTDANKLAGSINSAFQDNPNKVVILRVIGAGALNQAVKASIISNKFFSRKGTHVLLNPSFQEADGEMTAIELKILLLST
jgi:stage V sporulation protein S